MNRFCFRSFLLFFILISTVFLLSLGACRQDTPSVETPDVATSTHSEVTITLEEPTTAPEMLAPEMTAWPPQVIYSSPAPGEIVLLNGAMTIRFDQPMDQAAVESAFSISPATERGLFDWPRPDTLIYTPVQLWERQQTYRVRIDKTAVSQSGLPLAEDVELALQTVGYLGVSQVMPAASGDVAVESAITVIFNRPVVPLVTSGQQTDLPQPLLLEPPLNGAGEWLSSSIYRFTPDGSLKGGTEYRAIIPAGLTDITGAILESDYVWTFRTTDPQVTDVLFPKGSSPYLDPSATLTVTFNLPMEQATTETAVRLAPMPEAGLDFTWDDLQQALVIKPRQPLSLATSYTLTVGATARTLHGDAPLTRPHVTHFATYPYPTIVQTTPAEGELWDVNDFYWNEMPPFIDFAGPMDADSFAGRITIEPAPAEFEYVYQDWTNWRGEAYHRLSLDFAEQRNQPYTITLSADVQDIFGNRLGQDFVWHFSTIPYWPVASLNFPSGNNFMLLSNSFPTAVDLVYRNVPAVTLNLYDAELPFYYLTRSSRIRDYRTPSSPLRSWTIPSTAVADEAVIKHILLADGGALPTGVYFIEATVPGITIQPYRQTTRGLIVVADTNLAVKQMLDATHVWVTDIASGAPVAGRGLTLYGERGRVWGTAVTDANGFATLPYDGSSDHQVVVVSGVPGAAGFGLAYAGWNVRGYGYSTYVEPEEPYFLYLYTDRPIYRPGDTVYFKGIVRKQDYGRYHQAAFETIAISAAKGWSDAGNEIYRESLTLDENGAITGQFTLPLDIPLGSYQLNTSSRRGAISTNYLWFEVAEYRKPELFIRLIPDKEQALVGEAVNVTAEIAYYFGGPAADLPVVWEIYGVAPNYTSHSSSAVTDRDGRMQFSIPADFLAGAEGRQNVTVLVEVSGLGELPLSAKTSVTFHPAEVVVQARPQRYLNLTGQEMSLQISTTDWNENPTSHRPVTVTLSQVEWLWGTNEYGNERWIPQLTPVAAFTTTTGTDGAARIPFTPPTPGEYRLTAVASDEDGRFDASRPVSFYAIGQGNVRYPLQGNDLSLKFDQEQYVPGDNATLLIQSDFTEPVLAWLTIEQGPRLEQQVITLSGASHLLEIPIKPDYAPQVRVTVTAVRGTNDGTQFAAMRQGQATVNVSPQHLTLTLSLTPDDAQFLPGEEVRYDILVADYLGRPVQADLSLALVDLAVLSLKPDNAWPIVPTFYGQVRDVSDDGGSLFFSGEGLDVVIPIEPGGGGGGGGGGGLEGQPVYGLEEETRRDFPDTAYWQGTVSTDENGRAQVIIPLPDSLTTWRLSSKAVSHEGTLVGQESVDIQVSKPLLLRPVTPRFFTVGDVVSLGSFVHNHSAATLDVTVSLEATGVEIGSSTWQTLTLAAGESQLVQWPVIVQDGEAVDLTFRAVAGPYQDSTKPTVGRLPDLSLPVYRYEAPDIAGASGVLDEAGQVIEAVLLPDYLDPDNSQLQVQLTTSLAAGLITALEDTGRRTRQTDCTIAVTDRLLANATSQRAIQQLQLADVTVAHRLYGEIAEDLAELARLALPGGGWSWCGGQKADPMTTAFVLFSLAQAEKVGHTYSGDLWQSLNYLTAQTRGTAQGLSETAVTNRRAYFLYVLALHGREVRTRLDELLAQSGEDLDPYGQALLLLAYHQLLTARVASPRGDHLEEEPAIFAAAAQPEIARLLDRLNDAAILSATGAHWQDKELDWRNLNSDVRGTAVIIYALNQIDPGNPLLPSAVRWLMSARSAMSWPTTHETAWSILALSNWMARRELQPAFPYSLKMNGAVLTEGEMSAATVGEPLTLWLPAADLLPDAANLLAINRGAGNGRLYYTLFLQAAVPVTAVSPASRGIIVERAYYDARCNPSAESCQPITHIAAGQKVRVQLNIQALSDLVYLTIDDPIPAGTEALDPHLLTVSRAYRGEIARTDLEASYQYGYWGWWHFSTIQYRDDRVQFSSEFLPAGTYQYTYYLQTLLPGEYQVRPMLAQQAFFPDMFGRSAGMVFTVLDE